MDFSAVQAEIDRMLALADDIRSGKEEILTPNTPEAPATPEEEIITIAATSLPFNEVIDQSLSSDQSKETEPAKFAEQIDMAGQTIQGAWITHFDCLVEGNCGSYTASGTYLEIGGQYAACDTDYWEFGTQMTIVGDPNGYVWTCVDTGSAVKGPAHWDVWFYDPADGWKYLQEIGGDKATIIILP